MALASSNNMRQSSGSFNTGAYLEAVLRTEYRSSEIGRDTEVKDYQQKTGQSIDIGPCTEYIDALLSFRSCETEKLGLGVYSRRSVLDQSIFPESSVQEDRHFRVSAFLFLSLVVARPGAIFACVD